MRQGYRFEKVITYVPWITHSLPILLPDIRI